MVLVVVCARAGGVSVDGGSVDSMEEMLADGPRSFAPQLSQKPAPSSFTVPHLVQKIAKATPFFPAISWQLTELKNLKSPGYVNL